MVADRTLYKYHIGAIPRVTDAHYGQADLVLKYSNVWREVALVAQNENLFQFVSILDHFEGPLTCLHDFDILQRST